MRWYERAADQGNELAQYNLGVMLMKGQGAPQDFARGRELIAKSGVAPARPLGVAPARPSSGGATDAQAAKA